MSHTAMKWAWEQRVGNPEAKTVLVAMAWHADDSGDVDLESDVNGPNQSWPGADTIQWALDQKPVGPSHDKFVLMALAWLAGREGTCEVDTPRLKAMTELSALRILESLRRLQVQRLIYVDDGTVHLMIGTAA